MMKINVKCKGEIFNVEVPEDSDLQNLKETISKKKSVNSDQIRVIFNQRILSNNEKLSVIGISNDEQVNITISEVI